MEQITSSPSDAFRVRADGFRATLEQAADGDVTILTLRLAADVPTVPSDVLLTFDRFVPDVFATWTPDAVDFHAVRPDWSKTCCDSRSASGAPILSLLAQGGENRLTVSLSDAAQPCRIAVGLCEETARFGFALTFFTARTHAVCSYCVQIRLDARRIPFFCAIRSAREMWDRIYPPCSVPDGAREPLYSCWYSLHQEVFAEDVLRECALAAPYGMRTVILDDGWQTDDNNRGYAYCGDWRLATKKIPDMAALADAVHALGMRFMIWYSVPFVGIHSENYARFCGKYLSADASQEWFTLDPRFAECRAFLRDTYLTAARAWHLDGLKLDFIDSFSLTEMSSKDYAHMDHVSLEDAVQALLQEVTDALHAYDPDFLIEFRQSYIGPVMRRFGNMLRVGDCPGAAAVNRAGSITLRLLCGQTAVHSDMVMWNTAESPQTAADQITAVLYCVPQISVRLESLPPTHRKMLRFYLDFWTQHRRILLDGALTAEDPEVGYSLVRAERDGEAVITTYLRRFVSLADLRCGTLVNASAFDTLLLDAPQPIAYRVSDCMGEPVAEGAGQGLLRIPVPHSGMLFFALQ